MFDAGDIDDEDLFLASLGDTADAWDTVHKTVGTSNLPNKTHSSSSSTRASNEKRQFAFKRTSPITDDSKKATSVQTSDRGHFVKKICYENNNKVSLSNNVKNKTLFNPTELRDSENSGNLRREPVHESLKGAMPTSTSNLFKLGIEADLDFDLSTFDEPMEPDSGCHQFDRSLNHTQPCAPGLKKTSPMYKTTLSHRVSAVADVKTAQTNVLHTSKRQTYSSPNENVIGVKTNQDASQMNPSNISKGTGFASRLRQVPAVNMQSPLTSRTTVRNIDSSDSRQSTPMVTSTPNRGRMNVPSPSCDLKSHSRTSSVKTPVASKTNLTSNQSPWDLLSSTRTSCLDNTPIGSKRPGRVRRKFPGPAGALPKLDDGISMEEVQVQRPKTPVVVPVSEQEVTNSQSPSEAFSSGPWRLMLDDLGGGGSGLRSIMTKYNIANLLQLATKKRLESGKVPVICVLLEAVTIQAAEASAVFRDPTGSITGSIHRRLVQDYQTQLQAGSVLLLKQVGVFSPSGRTHYLNVTPNNLAHIYSPGSDGECECTLVNTHVKLSLNDLIVEERRSCNMDNSLDAAVLKSPVLNQSLLPTASASLRRQRNNGVMLPLHGVSAVYQNTSNSNRKTLPSGFVGAKSSLSHAQELGQNRSMCNTPQDKGDKQQSIGAKTDSNSESVSKEQSHGTGLKEGLENDFEDSWFEDNLDDVLSSLDEGQL